MSHNAPQLFTLEPSYELARPDIGPDSPAAEVFIDFKWHPPATLRMDDSLDDARSFLSRVHLAIMAVVDGQGHFRGLLTRDQLSEESIMRLVAFGQYHRDLQARDLMVPRAQLAAIEHDTLVDTTIGELVSLLYREGRFHVLVVDRHSQQIRGLISSVELARRLSLQVRPQPTFMDIFDAVMH